MQSPFSFLNAWISEGRKLVCPFDLHSLCLKNLAVQKLNVAPGSYVFIFSITLVNLSGSFARYLRLCQSSLMFLSDSSLLRSPIKMSKIYFYRVVSDIYPYRKNKKGRLVAFNEPINKYNIQRKCQEAANFISRQV